MLAIISPAKNMSQYDSRLCNIKTTVPQLISQTQALWEQMKQYQPWELETLMKVNEKLAVQAFADFQDYQQGKAGVPALLAYDGLVFKHIEARSLTAAELAFADQSVRILSGFYGLLRPLDQIQPYRLEMQCKVKIEGKNLYQFWNDSIYQAIYSEDTTVVNLASEEYARCVRRYLRPGQKFIDVEFLYYKKGKLKNVTAWAKMARGRMVRYIIQNKIKKAEQLQAFGWNGYQYEESLSTNSKYAFIGMH